MPCQTEKEQSRIETDAYKAVIANEATKGCSAVVTIAVRATCLIRPVPVPAPSLPPMLCLEAVRAFATLPVCGFDGRSPDRPFPGAGVLLAGPRRFPRPRQEDQGGTGAKHLFAENEAIQDFFVAERLRKAEMWSLAHVAHDASSKWHSSHAAVLRRQKL